MRYMVTVTIVVDVKAEDERDASKQAWDAIQRSQTGHLLSDNAIITRATSKIKEMK